jgi:hypothetical protein
MATEAAPALSDIGIFLPSEFPIEILNLSDGFAVIRAR